MAAVFPESMDRLDAADVEQSIAVMERYIRYMCERIEFSLANERRLVSAAGVSSVQMYAELQEAKSKIATHTSQISSLDARVTALENPNNT